MSMHHVDRPGLVESARRLKGDLQALKELFKPDTPTLRMSRGNHIGAVKIGFGDASGTGFGSSWESKKGISFHVGTWGEDMNEESSNLRELKNLVDTLEAMGNQDEGLQGLEVFMFPDNNTAESAFHNGSSKSKKLFELVLRVRKLEMHFAWCTISLVSCIWD